MKLPDHLFVSSSDGHLYDTRVPDWHHKSPLRSDYCRTHEVIIDTARLKATLRAGAYAWPGGYPLYFITDDGAALSFQTVRDNLRTILDSVRWEIRDGWRVIGCAVNWEDHELTDSHTGELIECSY